MAYGPIERVPVSVADVRTPVSAVGSGVRSARMVRTGRGVSGRGRGLQSGPPECNASLPEDFVCPSLGGPPPLLRWESIWAPLMCG